ncbi:outer membrane autotransporter barrel domain protein [Methylocella silvestris BL2]|uniref:Outer membrane autotransporter barrel domain protein n=1 Tax=Methylocella silvestris (strain DSM 15510 / CIP 108128 / LMG 27833 / NCIMB 13906 / BL2) TaxID=395965 RepID=B8ENQ5_METSB|nr:autotransporter domain-containing protein [Methylocella silvestris]ACK50841.1 outer membrane autotransporter barrel domain protein [Methylocella silvestris BL2]
MSDSNFNLKSLAAILLGGVALPLLLPASQALAACALTSATPTLDTVECIGNTTVGSLPVPAVPISTQLILGADGNAATINLTANLPIFVTGPAGTFFGLDTANTGAPSSIIGVGTAVQVLSLNGADIRIGQNSVGGGLNANIIGLSGNGISAIASGAGGVSITTAPGTLVSGLLEGINVTVVDGDANITFNGDVRTTTPASFYDIAVRSTGAGNINIGGAGTVLAGGITALSAGTGDITVSGSGNTIDLINGPGINAVANGGNITINRSGFIVGALDGVTATTVGAGNITISTVGDVTGNDGFGLRTSVANGLATINVGAGSTIRGSAGPISPTGLTNINNAGTLSFVNSAIGVTNWATTTLNGQGGALAIDVNSVAGTADRLTVSQLTGTNLISVANVGAAGLISTPIPILTATNLAGGATVAAAQTPGIIDYTILQSGNTFSLASTVNTSVASATPTSIDAMLTALNTGFFQNASAFLSEPPDPGKNQWNGGLWIRLANGRNDISSTTTAFNATGAASSPAKVRADFDGFQTGVDLGVANVEGTGWNTHLGVTAGLVSLRTNDLILSNITSQANVPFIGIYAAVTGHNFFVDAQLREDFYALNLTNPAAFLNNSGLSGTAVAANASAGYRFDLPSAWFIEPSVAFMYSSLHMDSLRVGLDPSGTSFGTLDFNPFESALGRAGARVGTTYVFEQAELALQPFVTGSVWREFAGDTNTTFSAGASSVPLSVTRIGTFGQVGVGVSGQVLKTGLLGFLRGDYRFGEKIEGYAVVAGMRYQF